MWVDEAGRDGPAAGIDDAEAFLVEAQAADPAHDLGQRPDGQDEAFPGRHGRCMPSLGISSAVAIDGDHVVLGAARSQSHRPS